MQAFKATALAMAAATTPCLAFKQYETSPFIGSTMSPQEMSIIDEVGRSPCVFKLGDNFYDYTPIKLAYPAPKVPYFDGNPIPMK